MYNVFYVFVSMLAFNLNIITASALATTPSLTDELPEVAQDADVHTLSKIYCKTLWAKLNNPDVLGYDTINSTTFREKFVETVAEVGTLLKRISKNEPIIIGGHVILNDDSIVDDGLLASANYFDIAAHGNLALALNSMKESGKHKGGSDLDNETLAHVNEILVYVWKKVKEEPGLRLTAFLIGLEDAAKTCIQGYSVRMLCAVHPPKQKTIAPLLLESFIMPPVEVATAIVSSTPSVTAERREE